MPKVDQPRLFGHRALPASLPRDYQPVRPAHFEVGPDFSSPRSEPPWRYDGFGRLAACNVLTWFKRTAATTLARPPPMAAK